MRGLREKSVASATLDDITARTSTSKSQLFHYFPAGKDELLVAVAQFEADQILEDQQPYLGCLDSWEAWERWRDVGDQALRGAKGTSVRSGRWFFRSGARPPERGRS